MIHVDVMDILTNKLKYKKFNTFNYQGKRNLNIVIDNQINSILWKNWIADVKPITLTGKH